MPLSQTQTFSRFRRILVILAWAGIVVCLWRLTYVLPLRTAAQEQVSQDATDYQPGDLITSRIGGERPHIAIVVPAPDGKSPPWIVHNRGFGPAMEDQLLAYPITGHFRWRPWVK